MFGAQVMMVMIILECTMKLLGSRVADSSMVSLYVDSFLLEEEVIAQLYDILSNGNVDAKFSLDLSSLLTTLNTCQLHKDVASARLYYVPPMISFGMFIQSVHHYQVVILG